MANIPNSGSQKSGDSQGGSSNFANDPQRASEAGRKGGQQSHTGSSGTPKDAGDKRGGPGNFANDPEKASEAGRKGGQHSHGGSSE